MKAKRGKCLALVAVLAMVVCAFAVAMPAGDSDAGVAVPETDTISSDVETTPVASSATIGNAKLYYVVGAVTSVTVSGSNTPTFYLTAGSSINFTSSGSGNVMIYYAADGDADNVPTKYYLGLVVKAGASSVTYTAQAATSTNSLSIEEEGSSAASGSTYGVLLTDTSKTYYAEGADVTAGLTANSHSVAVLNGGVVTVNGMKGTSIVNTIVLTNVVSDSTGGVATVTQGDANGTLTYDGTMDNTTGGSAATVKVKTGVVKMDSNAVAQIGVLDDTADAYKAFDFVYANVSTTAYDAYADVATAQLSTYSAVYATYTTMIIFGEQSGTLALGAAMTTVKVADGSEFDGTVKYVYTEKTTTIGVSAGAKSTIAASTTTLTLTATEIGLATASAEATDTPYLINTNFVLESVEQDDSAGVTVKLNGVAIGEQNLDVALTVTAQKTAMIPKDATVTFAKGGSITLEAGTTAPANTYFTILGKLKYDEKSLTLAEVKNSIDNTNSNAVVYAADTSSAAYYVKDTTTAGKLKSTIVKEVSNATEFMDAVTAGVDMKLKTNIRILDTVEISDLEIDLNGYILAIGYAGTTINGNAVTWNATTDVGTGTKGSLSLTDVKVYAGTSTTSTPVKVGENSVIVADGGSLSIVDSDVYAVVDVDDKATVEVDNPVITYDGTTSDVMVGYGTTLKFNGKATNDIYVYGDLIIQSAVTINAGKNMGVFNGASVTVDGELDVAGNVMLFDGSEFIVNGKVEMANNNGGANFIVGYNPSEDTAAESLANANGADVVVSEGASFVVKGTSKGIAGNNILDINNKVPAYSTANKKWTYPMFVVEGTLDIKGTMCGYVYDMGTVTFNGTSANAGIVLADGISFTADSVTGTLTVSDANAADIYDTAKNGKTADGNSVVITNAKNVTVSTAVKSATWKDASTGKSMTGYYANMYVSGSFTGTAADGEVSLVGTTDSFTTTNDGRKSTYTATIYIEDDVVVGKDMALEFAGAAGSVIYVTGTVSAVVAEPSSSTSASYTNGSRIAFAGATVDVSGHITVLSENITGTESLNAVEYIVTVTGADAAEFTHWTSFDEAVASVDDADDSQLTVYGYVSAYTTADIPAGTEINMESGSSIYVSKGVTLTLKSGAEIDGSRATISVYGTFVAENAAEDLNATVSADVVVEELPKKTWTSLSNAIAIGMTDIVLNKAVKITSDLEIPEGVTVTTNYKVDGDYAFTVSDCKLTVNGALVFGEKTEGTLYVTDDENSDVVVNGTLSIKVIGDLTGVGKAAVEDIYGAYFVIAEGAYNTYYVTSVENAAEIVSLNTKVYGDVQIQGVVASGDVEFIGAEGSPLTITMTAIDDASVYKAGTVSLVNATFENYYGTFTGSVETEDAAFSFVAAQYFEVTDGADETDIVSYGVVGAMVMESGEAVIGSYSTYDTTAGATVTVKTFTVSDEGVFTVADGAELTIPKGYTFQVLNLEDAVTAVIDGAIVFEDGAYVSAYGELLVNGTMDVSNITFDDLDIVRIVGALNVAEGKALTLDGAVLILGKKIDDLGATGTVSGTVNITANGGAVLAYAGASMDADLNINAATGLSDAVYTTYYINGIEYATIYTLDNTMLISEMYDLDGGIDLFKYDTPDEETWYATQDYNAKLDESVELDYIGDYAAVYRTFAAKTISGIISKDAGVILTIDDVVVFSDSSKSEAYALSVGTHKVSWSERTGYTIKNVKVTFDGKEIQNGDTITITADMQGYTLIVAGAEPYAAPTDPVEQDNGMKVTDYLLIVLVVLIAVMAIMVALRLMRS